MSETKLRTTAIPLEERIGLARDYCRDVVKLSDEFPNLPVAQGQKRIAEYVLKMLGESNHE